MKAAIFGFGRMGLRYDAILRKNGYKVFKYDKKNNTKKGISKLVFNKSFSKKILKNKIKLGIISATCDCRLAIARQIVSSGIPYLLIEKPLANSIRECKKIIQMCRKNNVIVSCNHQMRFMPQFYKIKKYLNLNKFGGLSCMTVSGGNFGLAMNGIHYFEAFRFLSDEKPWKVMAWLDQEVVPNPRGKKFQDRSGCVIVETKSGKRLILQCSARQGHGVHVTYAARNGWITIDELTGRVQASVRKAKFREEPSTRYALPASNWSEIIKPAEIFDSTAAVIRALLKDKNRVTGEDGLLAVKVLVAAHMSAERGGCPIFVNRRLDEHRKFPWA